jgi:hypothetical protein
VVEAIVALLKDGKRLADIVAPSLIPPAAFANAAGAKRAATMRQGKAYLDDILDPVARGRIVAALEAGFRADFDGNREVYSAFLTKTVLNKIPEHLSRLDACI